LKQYAKSTNDGNAKDKSKSKLVTPKEEKRFPGYNFTIIVSNNIIPIEIMMDNPKILYWVPNKLTPIITKHIKLLINKGQGKGK